MYHDNGTNSNKISQISTITMYHDNGTHSKKKKKKKKKFFKKKKLRGATL